MTKLFRMHSSFFHSLCFFSLLRSALNRQNLLSKFLCQFPSIFSSLVSCLEWAENTEKRQYGDGGKASDLLTFIFLTYINFFAPKCLLSKLTSIQCFSNGLSGHCAHLFQHVKSTSNSSRQFFFLSLHMIPVWFALYLHFLLYRWPENNKGARVVGVARRLQWPGVFFPFCLTSES